MQVDQDRLSQLGTPRSILKRRSDLLQDDNLDGDNDGEPRRGPKAKKIKKVVLDEVRHSGFNKIPFSYVLMFHQLGRSRLSNFQGTKEMDVNFNSVDT